MKSLALFIRQSTKNFIKIGAFFPSSSRLATRITKNIKAKVVLELGPGTGIFTKEVLNDDGLFIQFEYFLAGIKSVREFFSRIDINYEIFNIPPAFVMECKK